MKKILSERNLVVILFVVALVVFSFAQEDAKKVEKMYLNADASNSSIITPPKQTAVSITADNKPAKTTNVK